MGDGQPGSLAAWQPGNLAALQGPRPRPAPLPAVIQLARFSRNRRGARSRRGSPSRMPCRLGQCLQPSPAGALEPLPGTAPPAIAPWNCSLVDHRSSPSPARPRSIPKYTPATVTCTASSMAPASPVDPRIRSVGFTRPFWCRPLAIPVGPCFFSRSSTTTGPPSDLLHGPLALCPSLHCRILQPLLKPSFDSHCIAALPLRSPAQH
ncbi:hypothetical protein BS50DRAFT_662637 [Corynespora cassiicola Philippines]|uniref:Uncharacterized protein n=1 Tax=Corynespora cassiicola Philippines TaxID=1448308 RepID=A0A2T2NYA9_CORCC|nr:hypothetical protein BS50DRAFT_662637 [Corynespora cassiicola Philippines]